MISSKRVKNLVRLLLLNFKQLRDDDRRLCSACWAVFARKKYNLPMVEVPLSRFLKDFENGDFPHPESIRRMRQKLQERDLTLRGDKYDERKTRIEPEVREKVMSMRSYL